jgi:hypothetical protein
MGRPHSTRPDRSLSKSPVPRPVCGPVPLGEDAAHGSNVQVVLSGKRRRGGTVRVVAADLRIACPALGRCQGGNQDLFAAEAGLQPGVVFGAEDLGQLALWAGDRVHAHTGSAEGVHQCEQAAQAEGLCELFLRPREDRPGPTRAASLAVATCKHRALSLQTSRFTDQIN